ncbi:MAG: phosphoribosylformylglycinamidine synthase, partial [Patiriisocius sp.]
MNTTIYFFGTLKNKVFAVQTTQEISKEDTKKLTWLFGDVPQIDKSVLTDFFIGPRAAMITPWSTNAVEITQNMGIAGIVRIEEFYNNSETSQTFDPMLSQKYDELHQDIFTINIAPEPIRNIDNISAFNKAEGLALNEEEVIYLENLAKKIGRLLTDSEVFGFSQANSEHCRHKIFNGTFIIDGEEMPSSLFKMIKETSKKNHNDIVSA